MKHFMWYYNPYGVWEDAYAVIDWLYIPPLGTTDEMLTAICSSLVHYTAVHKISEIMEYTTALKRVLSKSNLSM